MIYLSFSIIKNYYLYSLGLCGRASLTQEKKEPTDDTGTDVYSKLV